MLQTEHLNEYSPSLAYQLALSADITYEKLHSTHGKFVDLDKVITGNDTLLQQVQAKSQYGPGWQIQVIQGETHPGAADNIEVQAIVLRKGNQAVVSYRGTHDLKDFLVCDREAPYHDLKIKDSSGQEKSVGKVHRGMYTTAMAVQDQVAHALSDAGITQVYQASHSLGGSLQEIARVCFPPEIQAKIVAQYSFGKPRECNDELATYVNKTCTNNFSVDGVKDLVPHLPPATLPLGIDLAGIGIPKYADTGTRVVLTDTGHTIPPQGTQQAPHPKMPAVFRFMMNVVDLAKGCVQTLEEIVDLPHEHLGYMRRLAADINVTHQDNARIIEISERQHSQVAAQQQGGHVRPSVQEKPFDVIRQAEEVAMAAMNRGAAVQSASHSGMNLNAENALLALKRQHAASTHAAVTGRTH